MAYAYYSLVKEKKEEKERNAEKAQQWEKYSQVEIQQERSIVVGKIGSIVNNVWSS